MEQRKMGTVTPGILGFGCMRFPLDKETKQIDEEKSKAMIRRAMEAGITYYDTAWPYHEGKSEEFMGRALEGFPRGSYQLATKLPCWEIESQEQAAEVFQKQLENLRTDYIDFYLLHSMTKKSWDKMVELGVVEQFERYQAEGKIRQYGFSFHDEYPVFEEMIRYRKWDFCQIQLNYIDENYQAGAKGCKLARSLGIPVVVMEPVKGGSLAVLPEETTAPLRALDDKATTSSWAMRWVGSFENVKVILSGMNNMEQLEDNLRTFTDFRPLSDAERKAMEETAALVRARTNNGCTACNYCMPCPAEVDIPKNFAVWNNMSMFQNARITRFRWGEIEKNRASQCIECGKCETHCPQNIPIREHLKRVTADVEAFIG